LKRQTPLKKSIGAADAFAEILVQYATSSSFRATEESKERLKTILIDSFAVALAALKHPAALAARRYASGFVFPQAPCVLWGTSRRTNAEAAALCNGVLLRCHDYNDLYIGRKSWGHPSDIIAALLAIAERHRVSGAAFLEAMAVGYNVTLALFDTLPAAEVGWDYSNLTCIAAVCAGARLAGLSPQQTREALGIAVIPHFASDEIESGNLNARGDLTMWKRFNGGDAMRQAVYACELAGAGAEGAVLPFEGRYGFLAKLGVTENSLPALYKSLGDQLHRTNLGDVVLKRWPVGSRAQSAIEATLDARRKIDNVNDIAAIVVRTTEPVFEHLVRCRPAPWAPDSRETADHSLPYIVAAAAFDARIGTDSFAPERVLDPALKILLRMVEVTPDLDEGTETGIGAFASTVEIRTVDGRVLSGPDSARPGCLGEARLRQMVEEKFFDSSKSRMPAVPAAAALDALRSLECCQDLRDLGPLLASPNEVSIDRDPEF
jgi:2-methylcitrate dehydratase